MQKFANPPNLPAIWYFQVGCIVEWYAVYVVIFKQLYLWQFQKLIIFFKNKNS